MKYSVGEEEVGGHYRHIYEMLEDILCPAGWWLGRGLARCEAGNGPINNKTFSAKLIPISRHRSDED